MENAGLVAQNKLCTGCGTCIAVCPSQAMTMSITSKGTYVPVTDRLRCKNCGLCIRVCPSYTASLNDYFEHPLGNYINCFIGYSTDEKIRWEASSGGLITELLLFMFDEGIIDGALVTRMSKTSTLRAEPFIARSKKEIVDAMGSKYCPVPANLKIKEILSEDGKFAVVGLPCHINGVRKAETLKRELRKKMILHLGLFCSNAPSFLGTKFLLNKLKVTENDIVKFSYRGCGWPGSGLIMLRSGKVIKFLFNEWLRNGELPFFKPIRCMLCYNITNRLADISFGDAWKLSNDSVGMSVIISRSEFGEKVLREARLRKRIMLHKVSPANVIRSQDLERRMVKFVARNYVWSRMFKKDIPNYSAEFPRPAFSQLIYAVIYCLILNFSQKNFLLKLIVKATPLSKMASAFIR